MNRSRGDTGRTWIPLLAAAVVVAACSTQTGEAALGELETLGSSGEIGQPQVIASFNPFIGELVEGIATDTDGSIYFSLPLYAQVRRLSPDGSQTVIAQLDTPFSFPGNGTLGLAVNAEGVYVANATLSASNGVWLIARDGTTSRIPNTEFMVFPNALTFDEAGNLYVTETVFGSIWRVPPGGAAELWIRHPALAGTGELPDAITPVPLGANGIAYRAGNLYVANTETGEVLRVRINEDGSAGTPKVVASGLKYLDGIAVDVMGNLYVAALGGSVFPWAQPDAILRISRQTGEVTTVAGIADGADEPASLAFGRGRDNQTLYFTNFAFFPGNGADTGPSIIKVSVGVPGL